MASISDLMDFNDVDDKVQTSVLLGNGFSIGVQNAFRYSSLRDVGAREGLLKKDEERLFQKFQTVDFEYLMRRLRDASKVNEVLGLNSTLPKQKYTALKEVLVKCVRKVHPVRDDVDAEWMTEIAENLSKYKTVFTTNYDQILYWVLGSVGFEGFTDLFYENCAFSPINVENWYGNTEVYYLHGALFIFELNSPEGSSPIFKVRYRNGATLLDQIEEEMDKGNLPLFVAEGDHNSKLASIFRNVYLSYALQQFTKVKPGLTIYGNSLSSADSHIVDIINKKSELDNIAISIYTKNRDENTLVDEMTNYEGRLRNFRKWGGTLEFFDFATSPFTYPTT